MFPYAHVYNNMYLTFQSGGLTSEEFKQAIQEAANFPLRPYVLPFLKSHIPLMQRDIASLAKANSQVSIKKCHVKIGDVRCCDLKQFAQASTLKMTWSK